MNILCRVHFVLRHFVSDIIVGVTISGHYSTNSANDLMKYSKRVLPYLKMIKRLSLQFDINQNTERPLNVRSDSDLVGSNNTKK